MKSEASTGKALNRIDEIRAAAHRLFLTRDGGLVLDYLNERFYDCVIKDDQLARQVGRRDVVLEINRLQEKRDEK